MSTKETPSKAKTRTLASAASGAVSGAFISACVQPLDVLRTRLQANAALGVNRGPIETLQQLLKEGGIRGMWRGTGPTVVRLSLGVAVHMALLENMKAALLSKQVTTLTSVQAALVGGLSRAVSAFLLCPVTVVKTRMEYGGPAAGTAYRNTAHALLTIARQEGPRALFKGLVPTIAANAPFSGIYYMCYSKLKVQLAAEGRPPILVNLASGVLSAATATLITQPCDVVRTHMQLNLQGQVATGGATTTWAALTHVLKQQGARGLLIGAGPRMVKRTAQTALVWALYEELMPKMTAAALAISKVMGQ